MTGCARTVCPDLLPWTVPSPDNVGLIFRPNSRVGPDGAVAGWDVLVLQVV